MRASTPTPPRTLSKSRLMRGLQCPKSLYLTIHHPELEPKPGPAQQAVFDQGHEVGREARERYPGGVLIDTQPWEVARAIAWTREAMEQGATTLYEATFEHGGASARVDILHRPKGKRLWDVIEVKSSTSVKDEHLQDVAIQGYALEGSGLKIGRYFVMHINNQCVAPDISALFTVVDVTGTVRMLQAEVGDQLARLLTLVKGRDIPLVDIGPHCSTPYECPFTDHCRAEKKIPVPSVLDLPAMKGERKWELYGKGILELTDPRLPDESPLTPAQARMVEAARTGKRFVDREAIRAELETWKWPLHYLDFETIGPAIPRFPRTRPYQQVPFQFSMHFQLKPGDVLAHFEYLHEDASDPRRLLIEALLDATASNGSIVAYNKKFEAMCLRDLAEQFPEHRARLEDMIERLVDPLPVMRAAVYDPEFLGSFSIKKVAPALVGEKVSYEGLPVGDGEMAQVAFAEMVAGGTAPGRREELRGGLLEYCKQDTLAMVLLGNWMLQNSKGAQSE